MKELRTPLFPAEFGEKVDGEGLLRRRVTALYGILNNIYGKDKLLVQAGKLDAVSLMRSGQLPKRVLALQRLIHNERSLEALPAIEDIPQILADLEEIITDRMARQAVEKELEEKVAYKVQESHQRFLDEIKLNLLQGETPENASTLKKYAILEKKEQVRLSGTAQEQLRPRKLQEVVGQAEAIQAILTKLASPFPQHMILYGPPGVGKTTAARLALEEAKKRKYTPFHSDSPFVEVNGATLRWDPREITNPLLGSVHDPIYQGARRDLAEGGVPEPKPGLVTEAHGGVLFIDEIGELDPMLQIKLLKVLEDKRVSFTSAYYDPSDPRVPKYIKKLFAEGAPADFILIGATTRDPLELNPAIRSRCAEVFFAPLTKGDINKILQNAAKRLKVRLSRHAADLISSCTVEGRQAINILADAYSIALYRHEHNAAKHLSIGKTIVHEVLQLRRLSPYSVQKASRHLEVGRVFGLGVNHYLGRVLEVEAVAFSAPIKGKGQIRFNDTAGSMAKDSLFNATAVIRQVGKVEIADYDLHVNVIGGGMVDGPSAGAAIFLALLSAIEKRPLRQDIAVSGELSIRGRLKAVGGIPEKIYGARQAGMAKVILPRENKEQVPADCGGIEIILVDTVDELLQHMLGEEI